MTHPGGGVKEQTADLYAQQLAAQRLVAIAFDCVLGASGQIAQWVVKALADDKGVAQTLLLRNPRKLGDTPSNAKVVIGSALDRKLLQQALAG